MLRHVRGEARLRERLERPDERQEQCEQRAREGIQARGRTKRSGRGSRQIHGSNRHAASPPECASALLLNARSGTKIQASIPVGQPQGPLHSRHGPFDPCGAGRRLRYLKLYCAPTVKVSTSSLLPGMRMR